MQNRAAKKSGIRFSGVCQSLAVAAVLSMATAPASAEGLLGKFFQDKAETVAKPIKRDRKVTVSSNSGRTVRPYLGRATWICTPSGFGKTARCFQRSRIQ